MKRSLTDKAYAYLNNEQGERICKDISKQACQHAPTNYFFILISNTFTKLGDTLSNPKTVLAWVMSYVNAPIYLISFIVPIRESGSMLPQIWIANFVETKARRKTVYIVGSICQGISIAAIGVITLYAKGAVAGWLIIGCLVCFSLSRSFCSVSSKDVLGKTIPKTRRGKLKGYTVSFSGVLVLAAGLFMMYQSQNDAGITFYAYTLFFASLMWFIAALLFFRIKEEKGETDPIRKGWREVISRLQIVKTDSHFRRFVIARSLLLCSALTAPFYVVLAQEEHGKDAYLLGIFIIANGLASTISAPVWGKLADKSSKNVMALAVLIASFLGIAIFCIVSFSSEFKHQFWLYPITYFILGIAHSGVRLGRKTYVVDMASGNQRTDYVAVSNTLIGGILLITGGISALASLFSVVGIILILSLFGLLGAVLSYRLPDVE
ncbi:MAG: MFS transporter [Dokdonia sp.]|jgi:MFS family permease